MPTVRFAWSPLVVEVRREACPRARWIAAERAWKMTAVEAELFIAACHKRLEFTRSHAEIAVDDRRWLVGFIQGAPLCQPLTS